MVNLPRNRGDYLDLQKLGPNTPVSKELSGAIKGQLHRAARMLSHTDIITLEMATAGNVVDFENDYSVALHNATKVIDQQQHDLNELRAMLKKLDPPK